MTHLSAGSGCASIIHALCDTPGAAAVPGFLDGHYQAWRGGLAGLSPGEWAAPLGPSWGPYAEATTVDLALHVLDEVIHHGAEIGVLRDLYSCRDSLHG